MSHICHIQYIQVGQFETGDKYGDENFSESLVILEVMQLRINRDKGAGRDLTNFLPKKVHRSPNPSVLT